MVDLPTLEVIEVRPLPRPSDYGSWDTLPEDPPESDLDLTNPLVKDALERRDELTRQWWEFRTYPNGAWRAAAIQASPGQAEAWRNWFLRRVWEGIGVTNGCLRRWSAQA